MKYLTFALFTAVALRAAQPSDIAPAADRESLTVDALVAQTVADNPELRFYEAEIEAARASLRHAGAAADPELSVSAGRKRVRDAAGSLLGEGTVWSVSVAQTFEWPGRLALRKAVANRQVDLAELGLARFRAALHTRARTLAYGLCAAQELAAATAEVAARYRELREVFLQRDPAGLTPLLETRVIEAQELALQRRATGAALAAHAALAELNQLRGAAVDAPLALTGGRLIFHAAPEQAALLAAARENNFDFRAAQLELEQQGFAVSLARHERRPGLTVSPFLSGESAGDRERMFGLGFTVPLPVGSRSGATVATAEARRRQAETLVLLAQRQMEREVITAAATFAAKAAEIGQWAPESATTFREAAALADRHYRLGAVPLATYVELQASYLDALEALCATQREALEAGLRLCELTGLAFNPVETAP
jgi:cobalt-zinc-cadmium efflux system outer membrane protein